MAYNNKNYGTNLCSRAGDTLNTELHHYLMFLCENCTMQKTETRERWARKKYTKGH